MSEGGAMPMTPEKLAELERLEKAATPGPWFEQREYDGGRTVCKMRSVDDLWCINRAIHIEGNPCEKTVENARLIAAARNALPQLLADLRRYREALELIDRHVALAKNTSARGALVQIEQITKEALNAR